MTTSLINPNYSYSVKELAGLWGVSDETIRRLFEEEDGVLDIQTPRRSKSKKRRYRNLRIPGHVALRVENRMRVVVPE
jgi:hypothetical protein